MQIRYQEEGSLSGGSLTVDIDSFIRNIVRNKQFGVRPIDEQIEEIAVLFSRLCETLIKKNALSPKEFFRVAGIPDWSRGYEIVSEPE